MHFGTLYLLGAVATRLGDKALAADSFAKAVAVDPANTDALVNLGIAQKLRGNPDEAMASFRRALEIDPSFAEAHNSLGKILQDRNRTLQDSKIADEALACFQRAVEIKPDFAEAHNNLGMELGNQEKLDEAVACYRRAVELNPAYADAHNNLGNVLRHQKELDEAAACYQRVIHINPNLAAAHNLTEKLRGGALQDGISVRDIYRPQWSGLRESEAIWMGLREMEKHGAIQIIEKTDTRLKLRPCSTNGGLNLRRVSAPLPWRTPQHTKATWRSTEA